jgi:hypothetical protein
MRVAGSSLKDTGLSLRPCLLAFLKSGALRQSEIHAGGPFGILLTVAWLVFPVGRPIYKRITTRPRD